MFKTKQIRGNNFNHKIAKLHSLMPPMARSTWGICYDLLEHCSVPPHPSSLNHSFRRVVGKTAILYSSKKQIKNAYTILDKKAVTTEIPLHRYLRTHRVNTHIDLKPEELIPGNKVWVQHEAGILISTFKTLCQCCYRSITCWNTVLSPQQLFLTFGARNLLWVQS